MTNAEDPLAGLPREAEPPGALKTRVRETLRAQRLIVPSRGARLGRSAGLAAAACVLLAAGVLIGRATTRPAAPARDARSLYLLLLYEDSTFAEARTPTGSRSTRPGATASRGRASWCRRASWRTPGASCWPAPAASWR